MSNANQSTNYDHVHVFRAIDILVLYGVSHATSVLLALITYIMASPLQTQKPVLSPLDQLMNGTQPAPPKDVILERAVSLTRGPSKKNILPPNHRTESHPAQSSTSRQQIHDLRAARLSQQGQQQIHHPAADHEDGLGLRNAFRDSVASDMSFNSITHADEDGFHDGNVMSDADRIANEVRGLTLRRRQSMDTVHSSEFGEGGRWAKTWAGSDDGMEDDDDEDDDEQINVQNMQAHHVTDMDIENGPIPDLGALGHLRNVQGAHAVFTQQNQPIGSPPFPRLQTAAGKEHTVSLTRSPRAAQKPLPRSPQSQMPGNDAQKHTVARRDTLTSLLGEIGIATDEQKNESGTQSMHYRTDSSSTVSTASGNTHVRVWPPTPSGSDSSSTSDSVSEKFVPRHHRDTLTAGSSPMQMGQRAVVEETPRPAESLSSPVHQQMLPSPMHQQTLPTSQPRKPTGAPQPVSPSIALASPRKSPVLNDYFHHRKLNKADEHGRYSDPNLPLHPSNSDNLGDARRTAIAQHGGRESLVSDLDVETLRLDDKSMDGDDESDPRRASTSTIGSFSSALLDEQRRRRSALERLEWEENASTGKNSASVNAEPASQSFVPQRNSSRPAAAGRSISFQTTPAPTRTNPDTRSIGHSPLSPRQSEQARSTSDALEMKTRSTSTGSFVSKTSTNRDTMSTKRKTTTSSVSESNPAEKFLTLGISHHESGDLSRSAYYFERSAKIEGGCVVGMCMWGMALREGWGVRKDQKRGFEWISRAASRAGELMATDSKSREAQRTEAELKAIRSELKLSVYELGKCFCYGWGVKMDKQMALEYFELAAKLGDSDAQAEAGALLAAGKGCKKDLRKAAMYYRMAEAQGYDTVGLSWIHKSKYDPAQ